MVVSFIGPRGSGKTTIARRLGEALEWEVASTDEVIERNAGKSIARIVADEGWPAFREREGEALRMCLALAERQPPGKGLLLDAGGGAILDARNRELIRSAGWCVYLTASPETLAERTRADGNRPALTNAGDGLVEVNAVLAEREALYRELADLVLETDQLRAEAYVTILQQ
jgi:shikimate kinase